MTKSKLVTLFACLLLVFGVGVYFYIVQNHDDQSPIQVSSAVPEYAEYTIDSLGITVTYPKEVLLGHYYRKDGDNPTVPITIVQNGEVVTLSRGFNGEYNDVTDDIDVTKEDLTVRTPYYSFEYPDPSYPVQIYVTKASTTDELAQFAERVYGKGCVLEQSDEWTEVKGYNISGTEVCSNVFNKGVFVKWNTEKQIAVAYQVRSTAAFLQRPYFVDGSQELSSYLIGVSDGLTQ